MLLRATDGFWLRLGCTIQSLLQTLPGMPEPPETAPEEPDKGGEAAETTAQQGHRPSGIITLAGVWCILLGFALWSGGFGRMWTAILGFVSGNLDAVRAINDSLVSLLSIMAASVVIEAPLMVLILALIRAVAQDPQGDHAVDKLLNSGTKPYYLIMTATVTAEELVTRGIFLGIPLLITSNRLPDWMFYGLFLVGNAVWAAVHLHNYKLKSDRNPIRILPQFIGGITLTIVFVNYGLLGAIMVHLAFNFLMLSAMRKGIFNKGEILVILWHALVAIISFVVLTQIFGKSLLDLGHWFDANVHSFVIPGWQIEHYLAVTLFLASAITILGELLLFDLHPAQIEAAGLDGFGQAMVILALSFISFFGLQFIGVPFDTRVLIMALVFLVVRKSASGSGMARVFWIGLPVLMLQLYAILALGWNSGVWLIALAVAAVELPDRWLRIQDAKWEGSAIGLLARPSENS